MVVFHEDVDDVRIAGGSTAKPDLEAIADGQTAGLGEGVKGEVDDFLAEVVDVRVELQRREERIRFFVRMGEAF